MNYTSCYTYPVLLSSKYKFYVYFQLLHTEVFTLVRVWVTYCSHHEAATLLQRRKHIFSIPTYYTDFRG